MKFYFCAENHDDQETDEESSATETDASSSGPLFVSSSDQVEGSPHHHHHHHHHHRHEHYPRSKNPAMYPAALKIALRNHIRTLCGTSHCVDSFVVYLNSPTRSSDGASLLWDADHNGEVIFRFFAFLKLGANLFFK